MSKWIAEFELEDGDTMPEHMDLNYKGAKIDFHCKPLEQEPIKSVLEDIKAIINTPNRGTCDYFIVDEIEKYINKHISGK